MTNLTNSTVQPCEDLSPDSGQKLLISNLHLPTRL